jgi:hypothetical protein
MRGFQFSVKNALLATGFIAAWMAGFTLFDDSRSPSLAPVFLLFSMPSAALGALVGRPWLGLTLGVGGFAVVLTFGLLFGWFLSPFSGV